MRSKKWGASLIESTSIQQPHWEESVAEEAEAPTPVPECIAYATRNFYW